MNQISFDPLDYMAQFEGAPCSNEMAHKTAMQERNAKLREMRSRGMNVKGWTLTGQLRQYASFGVHDGRVRNIYYINIHA